MPSNTYSSVVYAQAALFVNKPGIQKRRKLFGGRIDMPNALKTVCGKLFRIFSPNKCAPANKKKGFYTSRLPKNHEIEEIFVLSSKEL